MRNARIPVLAYYRIEKQTIPNKHSHMYTNTKYANVTFTSKCKCGIPRIIVLVNCARATSSSLCLPKDGPPVIHHRQAHAEHGCRLHTAVIMHAAHHYPTYGALPSGQAKYTFKHKLVGMRDVYGVQLWRYPPRMTAKTQHTYKTHHNDVIFIRLLRAFYFTISHT